MTWNSWPVGEEVVRSNLTSRSVAWGALVKRLVEREEGVGEGNVVAGVAWRHCGVVYDCVLLRKVQVWNEWR